MAGRAQPRPDDRSPRVCGPDDRDGDRHAHDARTTLPVAARGCVHPRGEPAAGRGQDRLLLAAIAQPGTRRTGAGGGGKPPGTATGGRKASHMTPLDKATKPIQAEGLTKRYGDTLALDGLDLSIEPGEVYGYQGPNGAGKTTTIRLLLGIHRPTRG